jgi:hypothetical protein
VADALRALVGGAERHAAPIDLAAVGLARDYLAEHAYEQTSRTTTQRPAEVMAKVLLLARDHEIKDPTILEQIHA